VNPFQPHPTRFEANSIHPNSIYTVKCKFLGSINYLATHILALNLNSRPCFNYMIWHEDHKIVGQPEDVMLFIEFTLNLVLRITAKRIKIHA
jgi:hypothetical protein